MSPLLSLTSPITNVTAPLEPVLSYKHYINYPWPADSSSDPVTDLSKRNILQQTWSDIPKVITPGKRYILISITYRIVSGGGNYDDDSNTDGVFRNSKMRLRQDNGENIIATRMPGSTVNDNAKSNLNNTGLWMAHADLIPKDSTDTAIISRWIPSKATSRWPDDYNTTSGSMAISMFILDNVSEYSLGSPSASTINFTSSKTSPMTLDLSASTWSKSFSHYFNLFLINTTNSSAPAFYIPDSGELSMTTLGSGDNGSNEQNTVQYHFSKNSSPTTSFTGTIATTGNVTMSDGVGAYIHRMALS